LIEVLEIPFKRADLAFCLIETLFDAAQVLVRTEKKPSKDP